MLDAATESPATAADPSGPATDELLSQLAGKEIDRLLADAGVEPTTDSAAAEAPAIASITPPAPSVSVITGEGPMPAAAAPGSAEAETPAAAAMTASAVSIPQATGADAALIEKELDQIVAQQLSEAVIGGVDAEKVAAAANSVVQSPVAEINSGTADAAVAAIAPPGDAVPDLLDRLEAGERSPPPAAAPVEAESPKETPPASAVAPAAEAPAEAQSGDDDSEEIHIPASDPSGPTLVGRVLDLATLPLDPFPASMRDVIGKIAIVTTLNAAAVLAYITFFRK